MNPSAGALTRASCRACGNLLRIVDDTGIAALQSNDLAECITGAPGSNHFRCESAAVSNRFRLATEQKHPRGKLDAYLAQVCRALAVHNLDALFHLKRISDFAAERLFHVCDERDNFFTHARAGLNHQFGEIFGVGLLLHESADASFHIENERVDAFRHFLAHDGSADEIRAFDGRGDVAQGVKLLVGRSDFGSLPNQAAMAFLEDTPKFIQLKIHVEARNRFEFVERAAAVAQIRAR